MSLDLRLLEVPLEFDLLEGYWGFIGKQMESSRESAKRKRDANHKKLEKLGVTPCDVEWDEPFHDYDYEVNLLLPRILYNPFLVSLCSVYESVVVEIAECMQKKLRIKTSIHKQKGSNFLDRAKKYYENKLGLKLSTNGQAGDRLPELYHLRNAVAHSNGRIDVSIVWDQTRKGVQELVSKNIGVQENGGYIIVNEDFLRETFMLVKGDLEDLIARYKEWDDAHKASSTQ